MKNAGAFSKKTDLGDDSDMAEDRLAKLINAAEVRNDGLRIATLDRIRLAELLRDRDTAYSLKTAEDIRDFLDENSFSAKDFVHVVRMLREDEGIEDAELSGSELRDVAGGLIDGRPVDTGGIEEAIEGFVDWVISWFD